MSDESLDPSGGNGAAEDEAAQASYPIMIGAQYIKDLSFENPLGADIVSGLSENPTVSVEVNTSARPIADDTFEVSLFIRGEAAAADKTVFIVELTYGGIVMVNDVPEENVRPLVLIEGPRHLFPFARAVVANITRDGGFPPLMIGPIDFASLYMENHAEQDGFALE